MYCSNCGKNIPDGSAICPECGKSTMIQSNIGSSFNDSPVKEIIGNAANVMKRVPTRLIAKIALLAAIICFAFPFVSISCDASGYMNSFNDTDEDYSMKVTYKGYNFIFPSTVDEDNAELSSGFDKSKDNDDEDEDSESESRSSKKSSGKNAKDEKTNGWLIAVVICCAVGCVVLFIKRQVWLPLVSAALSLAGIICLMIFKSNFVERYVEGDSKDSGISIENFLDIDYRYGFVLCMTFMIIGLVLCLLTFLIDKFKDDDEYGYY